MPDGCCVWRGDSICGCCITSLGLYNNSQVGSGEKVSKLCLSGQGEEGDGGWKQE